MLRFDCYLYYNCYSYKGFCPILFREVNIRVHKKKANERLSSAAALYNLYTRISAWGHGVKDHIDSNNKKHIIKKLKVFIDNKYAELVGLIFQHTVGLPIGTYCLPLQVDLYLYLYSNKAEFINHRLWNSESIWLFYIMSLSDLLTRHQIVSTRVAYNVSHVTCDWGYQNTEKICFLS